MTSLQPLLALLQLNDSAFPAGTFAHSYGLEQAVRDGHIRNIEGVEAFVASLLKLQASGADTRALVRAAHAASAGDLDAVCAADAALFATKAPEELRAASASTGARLLREVAAHKAGRGGLVPAYLDAVQRGRTPGTHPVAFAVAGSALGIDARELAAASLFATANTLWSAAVRLLPVSHRDVQGALHRLRPRIEALALEAVDRENAPLTSFHPLQEIASMRHRTASVRLFAS
jgi:urease accessory protein